MRALMVHNGFGDYTRGLTAALARTVDLQVLTVGGAGTEPAGPPGRSRLVVRPRFRDPRSSLFGRRLRRELDDADVDVLHVQATTNAWIDAQLARLRTSVPLVVTVHDLQPHPGDVSVRPGTFAAVRRLMTRADRVIVHGEALAAQAVRLGARHVDVVPHGELGSVLCDPRSLPFPPSEGTELLFFGRVQRYKGLEVLLAALPLVQREVPGATLTIAGDGPEVGRLGLDRRAPPGVRLTTGFVRREDVSPLFERGALVVLPYLEASQSGVAALAAGVGRAVVASAVGALGEVVEHGRSGLLVPPGEPDELAAAIVRLLVDPALRHDLELGAHHASTTRLGWDSIAAATVEVYRRAIGA